VLQKTLQEALVNIAKHARAHRARVRIEIDDRWTSIEVSDDGVGLSIGRTEVAGAVSGHFGLRQMRERIEGVGGVASTSAVVRARACASGARSRHVTRPGSTVAKIRIVIVDDHEVVRHGLRLSLELEPDMTVVGEARTGEDAVRMVVADRPDVVLLDVRLEGADGPEVCRRILEVAPGTAVVMLTNYAQDGFVLRSLMAGAKGYVIKDVQLSELKKMVRSVFRGGSVLDPRVTGQIILTAKSAAEAPAARPTGARKMTALSDTDLSRSSGISRTG
jgi:DNA-binding NarL/FixJ family response regulator